MKHILNIFIAVLTLALFGGCSDKTVTEVQREDYSDFQEFLEEVADKADYCTELTGTSASLKVRTKSGKVLNINEKCPLFEVGKEGMLLRNGVPVGITIDIESTWYEAPEVNFTEEGYIQVEGKDTGLSSKGLCAIDCGKYVYFYFYEQSTGIPSEVHGTFNPPLPKGKGILKVLFVGNSFNVDATEHLPGILTANGTTKVLMGRVYHGGCTLPQYNTGYTTERYCSYRVCRPGESIWDGDEEYDTTLKYAVEAEDWDIVTFMEYTGNQCCWSWNDTEKGHINGLIEKVFAAHPAKRPSIMFMLTQTFAAQSDLVKNSFSGDQMKMYETITDFAGHVLEDTCIDKVIATGTAVQNLRTSRLNADKKQDLSRDGYHLDYGVSRYAAACTVFYNIFEPCLGLTLEGNSYRWTESIEHPTMHSLPVTDSNVGLCRYAARAATDNPLNLTDMSAY